MQIECTGRQTRINQLLRDMAEEGSARIGRILGRTARSHVVLTSEKYRHIAEVEIATRTARLVALCESSLGMEAALREALSKAESQAVRYKTKRRTQKRQPKAEKMLAAETLNVEAATPGAENGRKGASLASTENQPPFSQTAHSVSHLHIVRTTEPVAEQPMTVEEAVKEAESQDREVFVFRDNEGNVNVLHRQRDGKMELIEAR